MPFEPLRPPPGFVKKSTDLAHEGRWIDGTWVRSVGGVIETIGGCERFESSITLTGICRGMLVYRALDDKKHVIFGTHCKLYHLELGQMTIDDITPIRSTGTLGSNPFTMVSGSAVVTVNDPTHGALDGDTVTYSGATAAHGITIDGSYVITRVDADNYEITHSSAATSSGTGGGSSVTYSYEINCGYPDSFDGFGFGTGGFGEETFGTARTTASTLGVLLRARVWHLWNTGEDVLAAPWDGNIYKYDTSAGGRATILTNAPTNNFAMIVAPERHVIALGQNGNRRSIGWSDIDDITLWTPAASNQAGNFQVQVGSELLTGIPLRERMILVFTDTHAIRMVYLGRSPWFSFRSAGGGTGIAGPRACTEYDGIAYWWGRGNFYQFDSFVREMPNQENIKNEIFGDPSETTPNPNQANEQQNAKIYCFRQPRHREIWWLYQSVGSATEEIDRYVIFNIDEREWYTGDIARVCGDPALVWDHPFMVGADGKIYQHEKGHDDDGAALRKSIKHSPIDLGDGTVNLEINGYIPDFDSRRTAGELSITFQTRDNPQATEYSEGPYTFTITDEIVDVRASGGQAGFEIVSNTVGGKFRMGTIRLDVQPAGDRR